MTRSALTAAAGAAGALALVGALAGGYELGRNHVITRTVTTMVTRTATVTAAPSAVSRRHARPSPVSATSPAAPATQPVIYDCVGHPVVAPSVIVLACADGGLGLRNLSWSGWGQATAQASGDAWQNTCTPNCAQGTLVYTPATVTVSALSGGHYTWMQISDPQKPDLSHGFPLTVSGQP